MLNLLTAITHASTLVDRRARTPEELTLILEHSQKRDLPTITVWIHEHLLEMIQKLWEHDQEGSTSDGPADSSGDRH
jgi:molybdopterin-guanine dinucleotide biosynthesis protein A